MKNIIFNYYNIFANNLKVNQDIAAFQYKGTEYLLIPFEKDYNKVNFLVNISKKCIQNGFYCHQIINNKYGNALSSFNKKNYILLKIYNKPSEQVDLIELMNYQKKYAINRNEIKVTDKNWGAMWQQKIDYLEEQMQAFGHKEILLKSFSYYIGLAENAIQYYNKIYISGFDYKYSLSHRRIYYPNYWINYANPLSFTFDVPERDLAELVKSEFFFGKINEAYEDTIFIIKTKKMSKNSLEMFMARLIFPTYYFDAFERILFSDNWDNNLIQIIERVEEYEMFLKDCFNMINKNVTIAPIPGWLL